MQSPTQPPDLLADLVRDGGGTYVVDGLVPFTPSTGYAVGIGGITLPRDGLGNDALLWACLQVAKEFGSYWVGTWLDGDTVYIDAVRWFLLPNDAQRCAAQHKQKAIYSFASQRSLSTFSMEYDS